MKFRIKVTLCMISLVAIIFGIGGTMLIYSSFRNSVEREKTTAQKSFNMILNTMLIVNETALWTSSDDIADTVSKITEQNDFFSGIRLNNGDENIYEEGSFTSDFVDLKASADASKVASMVVKQGDKYFLQLCGALDTGSSLLYLDAAYDITSVYRQRESQERTYARTYGVMIFFSALFSYVLAYMLTRPLVKLKKVAVEIADGDYEKRSDVKSLDEVGQLSQEFNNMTDKLVDRMTELNKAMDRQNQFIGDFTHELKTPMTSIIGYADLLRGQTLDREDALDAANYIFSEGKRLERMSNKMLQLIVAREDEVQLTSQNPSELVENVLAHHREKFLEQGISFQTQLESGKCMLEADFFVSLLVNLIENSRRAMYKGGTITVGIEMTETGCVLTVADDGCGIPEDKLEHLTEAFYRVDKSRSRANGGAGLGLSLCARIAAMHGGDIHIDSQLGQGTSIRVELKGGRA